MIQHLDNHMIRHPAAWLVAFLLCTACGIAQQHGLRFKTLSLEEGLSQTSVRCIMQDSRGFMWFGTEDGLNLYDGYRFRVFKTVPNDPTTLGSNFLRALLEDPSGDFWIGTNGGGLSRFNPETEQFIRYCANPRDSRTLSSNHVWAIHRASDSVLWVGTDGGGLNRFNPRTGNFVHYRHNPDDPHSIGSDRVLVILPNPDGTLWLGTSGGGLNLFDPRTGRTTRYMNDPGDPRSLGHDDVRAVFRDRDGTLWVGTDGAGLARFDEGTKSFTHYRHDQRNDHSLSCDRVSAVFEDASGRLWAGTDGGGLNQLQRDEGSFIRYRHDARDRNSLANDLIFTVYQDRSGILWIGTEVGGISKLDMHQSKFVHHSADPLASNSLNDNSIWSILEDSQGVLWIGTRTGGLNRLDRRTGRYSHFVSDPADPRTISGNHIRCIYEDRAGMLWLGTDGNGLNRFNPRTGDVRRYVHDPRDSTSISGNRVYCIHQDEDGIFWIGTRTGGLNRFDSATEKFTSYTHDPDDASSISDDFVYDILQDRSGVLWVGTFARGLNRFDRRTGTFVCYAADAQTDGTISSDCILSLYEDRSGTLWIATGGGGINRFDRARKRFTSIDERHGLANNVVYSLLEDDQGMLWLSTNKGISRYDPRTGRFKNYTSFDGLQSNEFNGGAYYRSRSGEMFFGGINGFNSFHPGSIADNPFVPPVYITGFTVQNRELPVGGNSPLQRHISYTTDIELAYDQNDFTLEFVALNYTVPEQNRYRYMLIGQDADWIEVDASRRTVPYMNLDPGEYSFRVQGSNNDGVWNEKGCQLHIVINPPFWRTWWFRLLVLAAMALAVWLFFQRRIRTVRLKAELQAAHDAQMSIMPQCDPQLPGFDISGECRPAHEVGGDFFDYLWLDGDGKHFGIVVGDVSGKAMNSAMTAVMASGMIYAHARHQSSVGDIVSSLNGPLHAKTGKNMFTALCLSVFDTEEMRMTFTNAGLLPPLWKSDGGVTWLESTGPRLPLGSVRETRYEQRSVQLRQGDVLVFMTDGITEAQNAEREFYGTEHLTRIMAEMDTRNLSAAAIRARIVKGAEDFSGSATQYDDMTVVVVKILPPGHRTSSNKETEE